MRTARFRGDDAGAAVVEFVMIAVLLLMLLFAVLQVAVYFYARNVASSSVADAARYAAAEGVAPRAGVGRAERLIHQGLDAADADAIDCSAALSRDVPSGLATVTVRCRGRVRLLFTPLGLPLSVDVTSRALREHR
ncbi:TadE-like protein [Jatrophihabitans endophyticus]|uniref:TadE-like protein n=1 Tax=Jatrophihabitans endophyticus TaxID=1206085 RepID=A0A1M5RSG5_9ACTN|nr:TadE/TadG family type IV pilus assembly protein [Jatrophihabitans endophyticus]SHH29282.1 TadE-like protein [Jatrophihabitans endophyticus]